MSKNLLENYCKKIDELAPATFNEDQKILAKKILEKADEKDLQNIFQMLIQRIKIGFTFDVAPTYQKEDEQSVALLKKDEERSFKNYENTSNIENTLIIGENYDALKNLLVIERERESSSHSDAYYDVIYIDPPYNTESAKDDGNHLVDEKSDIAPSKFVYRDKFSRNGWLNMLNERLRLAKQLLKDDGVIFVSIDDNEQAYLKVLMDEIFEEENFVTCFPRKTTKHIRTNSKYELQKIHDYIIAYGKNKYALSLKKYVSGTKDFNLVDENGAFLIKPFQNSGANATQEARPNLYYPIYYSLEKQKFYSTKVEDNLLEIFPLKIKNKNGRWLWKKETFENRKDELIFKNGKIYRKEYLENDEILEKYSAQKTWLDIFENRLGSLQLSTLNLEFPYPKPIDLIIFLINLSCKNDARILDFYAGSGTTGHAVMDLNKEDNGNRTYTLITNDENNIGYGVCYERLYRINNGVGTNGETFEWTNKNKPYKQNLNVFSIDYYDTSILKKYNNDSITNIKKSLNKEIEEFGITPSINFNVDIYYDLLSLKPIIKESK